MRRLLIVVDMQNDFISGALGSKEAQCVEGIVADKIIDYFISGDDIAVTMDTHGKNYLETPEGRKLPVEHCIRFSSGWALSDKVYKSLTQGKCYTTFFKETFGSVALAEFAQAGCYGEIELVGVCTDICVVSNALLLKAYCPDAKIIVDSSCCAGTSVENHIKALDIMRCCQINVI